MAFGTTFNFHTMLSVLLKTLCIVPGLAACSQSDTSMSLSTFIPFQNADTNIPTWNNAPILSFTVDGEVYNATMDTGSTGLLLSAADLADYDPETAAGYPIGWQFYTSSKVLEAGNWIPKTVQFANMTATVPVLAVTNRTVCPWYNLSTNTNYCPTSTDGQQAVVTSMPTGVKYLGVGFGREYNGQPQGTPDKVPFLNIASINGQELYNNCLPSSACNSNQACLHQGYIINSTGVTVGITDQNMQGFTFTELALNHSYSDDPRDWTQTPACISVNGETCEPGSVLLDTGVDQAYLTIPPSVPIGLAAGNKLADNQSVTIYFGSESPYNTSYQFVIGQSGTTTEPTEVIVTQTASKSVFFNTGRHFYRGFDVLYDAACGRLGLRMI